MAKGGRIGRAQALLGGLLKIRPILSFEDHSVVPLAKAFGFEQALNRIVDMAAEDHRLKPLRRIFVIHGAAPQAADRLEQKVREKSPGDFEILCTEIGAVIGTHVGPGAGLPLLRTARGFQSKRCTRAVLERQDLLWSDPEV